MAKIIFLLLAFILNEDIEYPAIEAQSDSITIHAR